jgi:glycosyltransferase involved in cell wall biosynthesis
MKKHSLLFIIDGIEFGGGERTFLQLIENPPPHEYEIYVATTPGNIFFDLLTKKNLKPFPLDLKRRVCLKIIGQIISIIKEKKIDIIHSQGAKTDFYARLACRKLHHQIKIINTIAMPVEGYDVGFLKKTIYCFFDRFSEKYVDRFIVVSETLKETLVNNHGIPPEKVKRIYNGIELNKYRDDSHDKTATRLRKEYHLDKEIPLVGAIGRIVWQKGFEYLVKAIPRVINTFPSARFVIVGDGPLKKDLELKSIELGVKDKIIFTGFRNDIKEILASMDMLIIPSLREGSPMITLEAMAMAKPIIASDIDGIKEQLEHRKNGLLIPPENPDALAESILFLLKNKETALTLGQAAKKRVEEEFTIERTVKETILLYKELLMSHS